MLKKQSLGPSSLTACALILLERDNLNGLIRRPDEAPGPA